MKTKEAGFQFVFFTLHLAAILHGLAAAYHLRKAINASISE
jgi:hypothetical protein